MTMSDVSKWDDLADDVARLRILRKISLRTAASEIGINYSALHRIERTGIDDVSFRTVRALYLWVEQQRDLLS